MSGNRGKLTTLAGLLIGLVCSCSLKAEPIQVLTYEEAPFAQLETGKKQGVLVELLAELFARAELSYELNFVPLKRALLTTERSDNHCVLPVERSQEREARFQWIGPVLISRYGLFSPDNLTIPLTTLSDAKSYTVGSYLGSGIAEYLKSLDFNVELASVRAQNIKKLQHYRIDLWAAELISAAEDMRKQGIELGEPEIVFYTSIRAMACNLDLNSRTKQKLDSALASMYRDGFMEQLYRQYGVEISN